MGLAGQGWLQERSGMQGGRQPSLEPDSVRDTVPPDRGGCCPALRRLVPVGFGAEAWTLFALSGPLGYARSRSHLSPGTAHIEHVQTAPEVTAHSRTWRSLCVGLGCTGPLSLAAFLQFLFQVLTFMIHIVSSVFCGHLGKVELASVTLSVAFVNVCGISIGIGLSSACDTLMSQSFGSPNKKHVGVILQRSTLVMLLCCLPCWALFLNTHNILLLFRQDPAVSRLTQEYVLIFIPALPAFFLYSLLAKYLQNQGIVWPQVLSGIVGNCINGLGNYILVSVLSLGVRGSAYANTISHILQTIFLFLYIVLKKLHLETWAGWSGQCLQDWGPFFSLAVPSMLMVCMEWWAYEIGSFLMGLLSVLDLSGQAIIYELATAVYMIPLGLSNAVCVRVGMALGAADIVQAKQSAKSGMLCTGGTSLVVGIVLSTLKNKLGRIFTNDEQVIALVNKVLPIYTVFQLFEAICCIYSGVLRGSGKQAFGAVVNMIMYYVIGLPLGIVLTFVVRMGIMGLWLGMLACGLLGAAAFAVYTARMDWKLAAEEAQKHAGLLPQSTDSTVATVSRPGPAEAITSSVATGASPGITLTMYSRPESHLDLFRTLEAAQDLPAPASRLSARQLAIRRGAALGMASGTLTAGLVVRVLTTRH
ncbi:multidrug and toxin extrusion protein 2-like [Prionailurus viverrinus]|uniref:multidrug and toxin extrusion protein 2-like n=1 Tax=Prionailurus viverrinus TaxID=61388 RepID=UPI001FF44010|nr:multidrug and toxin extrusion protein 2-like [Prionailurus viverrinus]